MFSVLPNSLPNSGSTWVSRDRLLARASLVLLSVLACDHQQLPGGESSIDFSRDILPLLSENCFQCHGPDEAQRQAGLRLDQPAGALAELDSGQRAIVPGQVQSSGIYLRLTTTDPDLRMPPPESGKKLSDAQLQRIEQWIRQGAQWSEHWAFRTPRRPTVPPPDQQWRSENSIDLFIHARLREARLEPESRASKETLIRRVTLDLIGLPPTIEEVNRFLADQSPHAYERVVDRLLRSQQYGEQMARIWLDAARFADTHGLHLDNERSIWPYRDWVIKAFNRNLPFDQFTLEQLAGDLLPEPTLDQLVATGFNRCNVTTSEGGSIDEEYYVRYAVDRVETTSTVWLGLTAGCAACHDHKFDPLTQKEFYQLFSYFFSLTEKAMDGNALLPPPTVKVPTERQAAEQKRLEEQVLAWHAQMDQDLDKWQYTDPLADVEPEPVQQVDKVWFDDDLPEGAKPAGDGEQPWRFVSSPEHPVLSGNKSSWRTGKGLTQHSFTDAKEPLLLQAQDRLFAYVYLDPDDPPETVQLQFHDGSWEHRAYWGADKGHAAGRNNASNRRMGELPQPGQWVRLQVPAESVGLKAGAKVNGWAFTQFNGTAYWDKAGVVTFAPLSPAQQYSLRAWEHYRATVTHPPLPSQLQEILTIQRGKRSAEQVRQLTHYFLKHVHPESRAHFAERLEQEEKLSQELTALKNSIPATLIMQEREQPRQAHVLERGEYTLKREEVASRVPGWLGRTPPDAPENRLGLAQWLIRPDHPLTARVTVNRIWQHFFGTGLVRTADDFGIQGEHPSHPNLLDWLAVEFVASGWDVKRLHKMIVMSETYRQSSRVSAAKLSVDPENRLLARGPRFRLDAEVIRDQALAISGLLVPDIGGKSVRPYQPEGLWKPVGFGGSNTAIFKQDSGPKLYRRSMYTFWKRTSPPPSMTTFDAPDRETCQVRRARTNTPLQALVLMNDVQYIEAARKFAERVMTEGGTQVANRVTFAFRTVLARQPTVNEMHALAAMFRHAHAEFVHDPSAAMRFLEAGEAPRNPDLQVEELAAWTMVTHLLLNLSETITKG